MISINTIHNLNKNDCANALREIERVSMKHSFITVDAYRNEIEKERSEKNKEKVEMKKKVKKMRDDAEKSKSTLGDIDALSSLKGKMDE